MKALHLAGLVAAILVLSWPGSGGAQNGANAVRCGGFRLAAARARHAPEKAASQPKVHTYYIAADEVEWNYMPSAATYVMTGENETTPVPPAKSNTYRKAIYREYTDATFAALKPRPPELAYLGILGPLIRAEVGDTVKVVFKNNTRLILSMHPHGLAYDSDSEGAFYSRVPGAPPDMTNKGDAVKHGEVYTYTWTVPERAGPGPGDPSSILWMYHSHFNESRDMNSGLLGPIIVSRKGTTKPDGTPKDVDREFVVAFAIFEESASAYFMQNIVGDQHYPNSTITNPNFSKTLEYYTMNGFIKGTMPLLTMKKGERVRWYLMANSNEDDVHAPHWHGATVLVNSMRTDTVSLGPMSMIVADMIPDDPGTWLFHCHVNDHFDGGMYALFKVTP
ncbi:MAG TPA: multicopper oxidase domain-containing protein [Candidatus Baltobacteraceae bacterium]|nr:multicopper oxidase domain-containing protein [Candidatus Baltobacteraceae bacterium]